MNEPLPRGARVERLASPLSYVVQPGVTGTVLEAYPCDPEDGSGRRYGYRVHWDARPEGSTDFTAGSRVRPL